MKILNIFNDIKHICIPLKQFLGLILSSLNFLTMRFPTILVRFSLSEFIDKCVHLLSPKLGVNDFLLCTRRFKIVRFFVNCVHTWRSHRDRRAGLSEAIVTISV